LQADIGTWWVSRVRRAFFGGDRDAVKDLARDQRLLDTPPAIIVLLTRVLREIGEIELAFEVLRQAQHRHPGDFWINERLGFDLLELKPPQAAAAVGYLRAAVASRPENSWVRSNLGVALTRNGQLAEAEVELREAVRLRPQEARHRFSLGTTL